MDINKESLSRECKALSAFAEAWNKLDASIIAPFLKDNFHYSSFYVFAEIESRDEYLTYLRGKFQAIKTKGSKVVAYVIPNRNLISQPLKRHNLFDYQ